MSFFFMRFGGWGVDVMGRSGRRFMRSHRSQVSQFFPRSLRLAPLGAPGTVLQIKKMGEIPNFEEKEGQTHS